MVKIWVFFEKVYGFFEKNLIFFFKIAKGGQFAVECVSNGIIFSKCLLYKNAKAQNMPVITGRIIVNQRGHTKCMLVQYKSVLAVQCADLHQIMQFAVHSGFVRMVNMQKNAAWSWFLLSMGYVKGNNFGGFHL